MSFCCEDLPQAPDCGVAFMPDVIDIANAGEIWERLLGLIRAESPVLIVDMSATSLCDVHGVRMVARTQERALVHGVELRLVIAALAVRRIFELAQPGGLFVRVYPDLDSARLAPVGAAPPGPRSVQHAAG